MRKFSIIVTLIAAAGAMALAAVYQFGEPVPVTLSSGKALVGGPFELTSQTGAPVKDSDFRGKYMLVMFGYTFCPDVCPSELQVMSAALDKLGSTADSIQPLFITIDPERDTPEALAQYMENFHPSFVGLTGTPAQIAEVAKVYRVYYARAGGDESSSDYLMDHSSIIYLMARDGSFLKHFAYGTNASALADGIRTAIGG